MSANLPTPHEAGQEYQCFFCLEKTTRWSVVTHELYQQAIEMGYPPGEGFLCCADCLEEPVNVNQVIRDFIVTECLKMYQSGICTGPIHTEEAYQELLQKAKENGLFERNKEVADKLRMGWRLGEGQHRKGALYFERN